MTQCDRIMKYMRDYGSITTLEAFNDLGVTRLASRISDLRNAGVNIQSQRETRKNRYGERVSYARYTIAEEPAPKWAALDKGENISSVSLAGPGFNIGGRYGM